MNTVEPAIDVAVVGGGVVGTAVARLLSHHELTVALVEAKYDVGAGTSKANTAILHTGFDATPGSHEARLVARGAELLADYAVQTGISLERVGAVLVAWDDEQAAALPGLQAKAVANGYHRCELIDAADVYAREPYLGPGATAGMTVPDEHIIDPWTVPLTFAREAIANGCNIHLGFEATAITLGGEHTVMSSADGRQLLARFVVNAAGLAGDTVHRLFGLDGFTIRPRRGELIVFDKFARGLLTGTVLPVPTATTKGVLVAPTVFGNVMLGPTADDIGDRSATGSTADGIDRLMSQGRRILPALLVEEVTAVYAGVRAATEHSDYQLSSEAGLRYVGLGGIRSTGLTSAMALAEEALRLLRSVGLVAVAKVDPATVIAVALGEAGPRPYERGGRIICHCERVTETELRAATSGVLAAVDIDGVRRRTRATAGRCQGFYCAAEVCAMAADASGRPMSAWMGR